MTFVWLRSIIAMVGLTMVISIHLTTLVGPDTTENWNITTTLLVIIIYNIRPLMTDIRYMKTN